MTKKETKDVKNLLNNVDKEFVLQLLEKINLSERERQIIKETELNKTTITDMADKLFLSPDSISHIKQQAVKKIYLYSIQKNYIKTTS